MYARILDYKVRDTTEAKVLEEGVKKQGVTQGCIMSPWLFNLYMDNIVREARLVGGVEMEETVVQLLLFADDLMLVAENDENVERNLRMLDEVMEKWRMLINWRKTKVLTVKRGGGTCDVSVKGEKIEAVKTMKYLVALFNEEGSCEEEIENRIGAASKVIGAMRSEVLERRELSKGTKLRVLNAMVRMVPTLLYGCETWTIQKRHVSRLQATEMRYLRRVEGVTKLDKVRNEDIRQRLKQEAVVEVARKKQRAWEEKLDGMEG